MSSAKRVGIILAMFFFPIVAVWLTYSLDAGIKRFLPFIISGAVLWAIVMFTLKGRKRF